MNIHKNIFQPKDSRAIGNTYNDEDDLDDLFPQKTMTDTQALVDFLKTTSPEEFQRPERMGTSFFSRMRRPKRVPSTRSVPTNKKKSVETVVKSAGNSRAPSFDTDSIQTLVTRNPILPNNKRESSLYSGSLRHSTSLKSHSSRLVSGHPESLKLSRMASDAFVQASEGNDVIESALLQRLERARILDQPAPSDQVAAGLAIEHIRALGITHLLEQNNQEQKRSITDKKTRHMQVQTMDWPEKEIKRDRPIYEDTEEDSTRARRAEVALEEALDNLEVISGLAYKKLREIWEEKMRWENACIELRNRFLAMEQNKKDDGYLLEEDEDDLGLSEFPMQ